MNLFKGVEDDGSGYLGKCGVIEVDIELGAYESRLENVMMEKHNCRKRARLYAFFVLNLSALSTL